MRNTFYLNSIIMLVLSLSATLAQAQEQYCEVRNDYVVRNEAGRAVSTRLSGNQICVAEAQLRSFYVNGEVRQDYFREVRSSSGESYWVAASGVREGARIAPPVPPPRPSNLVQVSTPTQSQVVVETGYLLRSSPQQVDRQNVVGDTTSIQGFTPVFERGVFQIENEYVKGTVNGEEVWLHESAISLPPLVAGDLLNPPVPQPSAPTSAPTLPTNVASDVRPDANPPVATEPPLQDPLDLARQEQAELRQREQEASPPAPVTPTPAPTTPASTEITPSLEDPLVQAREEQAYLRQTQMESEEIEAQEVIDPNIPRPQTMPQGLREQFAARQAGNLFETLPAGNWGATTVNLNLRNQPGVSGSQVQGLLQQGGRVAVINSRSVEGRIWHEVVPFDCGNITVSSAVDPNMFDEESVCNQSYWVAGSNIEPSNAPSSGDITARIAEENFTEAGFCTSCRFGESSTQGESVQSLSDEILAATEENNENLLEEYEAVQAEFLQANPPPTCNAPYALLESISCKSWGREHKALFIAYLIERMGHVDASRAILALTAWAEARGQGSRYGEWGEVGEMGMVITVMDNRAVTNYRTANNFVATTGNETPEENLAIRRMGAVLHPEAFSAWNTSDDNLFKLMLVRRNHGADGASLETAFETVQMFERGEVAPVGELVERNTRHYHATYVNPRWATRRDGSSGHQINPQVRTPGGIIPIESHLVRRGTY